MNLPQNYMFYDGGCSAFGTLLFANLLPRLWNTGTQDCIGSGCYGWTHIILIVANLVGMAATCAAGCRSRELYRRISISCIANNEHEEEERRLTRQSSEEVKAAVRQQLLDAPRDAALGRSRPGEPCSRSNRMNRTAPT